MHDVTSFQIYKYIELFHSVLCNGKYIIVSYCPEYRSIVNVEIRYM